ncbi:MAG TPA: cell division/cell wall cluster transcriptional repressor MraZ [Acidimicrobiia bacterium]|nr:cell division/cell wall cluster transcriptional repressor MraZ [Acidimicrobiia bacterium]
MFLGDYIHTLDEKGRVVMPSSFRAVIKEEGGNVVVTKGPDGNLVVFTEEKFREVAQEEMERPRVRETRRDIRAKFAAADLQKMDSQGRIAIKPRLREYAGIQSASEVAVVGVFDRIEIWDVAAFEQEQAAADTLYRESEETPGF